MSMRKILLAKNSINHLEISEIERILKSNWLLNGPEVVAFENDFKSFIGCRHAVAVSSCTAGMHLCLSALELQKDDEVILPAFNFIASGIAVLQAGAIPVFCDVLENGNLDPTDLKRKISSRTRAVLLLHYAGLPADLDVICKICDQYDIAVIQDAAHAMGAIFHDKMIGTFGNATVFSFGPTKHLVTAMGGMVTTDDKNISIKLRALRGYGMDRSMFDRRNSQAPWAYEVSHLGHNFRMTDIAAAMGRVQLKKLEDILSKRLTLAKYYHELLNNHEYIKPLHSIKSNFYSHSFLYYVVKVKDNKTRIRDELGIYLNNNGVNASVHWHMPLNKHQIFKDISPEENYPVSNQLSKSILTLPLHQNMCTSDIEYVFDKLNSFFR